MYAWILTEYLEIEWTSFRVLIIFSSRATRLLSSFWCIERGWRKSPLRNSIQVFCEKNISKNFAIFTGKYLSESSFNNVAEAYNFIKKETLAQVFSCNLYENFKNTFFIEHLRRLFWPVTWNELSEEYVE